MTVAEEEIRSGVKRWLRIVQKVTTSEADWVRPRSIERVYNQGLSYEGDMKERLVGFLLFAIACSSGKSAATDDAAPVGGISTTFPDAHVDPTPTCLGEGGLEPVAQPVFVRNMKGDKSWAETGWFSSPGLVDLNGDGKKEIVAPFYSLFVFNSAGNTLATIKQDTYTKGRIYAPAVVADLDGDGVVEIVAAGNKGTVAAYEWKNGTLAIKKGWPVSTDSAGQSPEGRGMAAGDLDGDGKIEVVVTTTNTADKGSQVFAFSPDGKLFAPAGVSWPAWPRYNTRAGLGGDADTNGQGQHGYGCFGLNVGIANIDDDAQQEIIVTNDTHQIIAFKADGTSIQAAPYFSNPATEYLNRPMTWGQFIRWVDPVVEENHYHLHTNDWPDIKKTMWLQWTESPPSLADLDGDGKNEVIGISNAEMKEPYETQGWAFVALQGATNGGIRSAMRLPGWETLPMSNKPAVRSADDYYPPGSIPSPAVANILGDSRPEIVAALSDGAVYAVSPDAQIFWRYDYAKGAPKTFASEPAVVDLNRDGVPEIVFGTYALTTNAGRLVILSNTGAELFDIPLPGQGKDGNGIGVPAAPSVADLDGDGTLEIVLLTFDHGVDIFNVPGSGTQCLPWPTGRGNLLRNGQGPATVR
jgi:hypothetical protein